MAKKNYKFVLHGKTIEDNIEYHRLFLSFWETAKRLSDTEISKETDGLETWIYWLYLRNQSVTEVAKIVNDSGERLLSNAGHYVKYGSTDISGLIRETDISNQELQKIVRTILGYNTYLVDLSYN